MSSPPPIDNADSLQMQIIKHHDLTSKHMTSSQAKSSAIVRGEKKQKTYMKTELFSKFPWAIYNPPMFTDDRHGKVLCGICSKANELKCNYFVNENNCRNPGVKKWALFGFASWHNNCKPEQFQVHQDSEVHKVSIEHLHNLITKDVRKQLLNERALAYRTKCQQMNRHFFGVLCQSIFHLVSMGDAPNNILAAGTDAKYESAHTTRPLRHQGFTK